MTTENTVHQYPDFYAQEIEAVANVSAAYFSHHRVEPEKIGEVVRSIRNALVGSIVEVKAEEEKKPAVPISKSKHDDFLICLEDGKKFKSLKRHLRTHYNLTPEEYRAKWGLPASYPMVAPNYSATRSKLAKDNGLGRKQEG